MLPCIWRRNELCCRSATVVGRAGISEQVAEYRRGGWCGTRPRSGYTERRCPSKIDLYPILLEDCARKGAVRSEDDRFDGGGNAVAAKLRTLSDESDSATGERGEPNELLETRKK